MDRNSEAGLPPPNPELDERLKKPNETYDRDSKNERPEGQDVEPGPTERPDLDWAEHED